MAKNLKRDGLSILCDAWRIRTFEQLARSAYEPEEFKLVRANFYLGLKRKEELRKLERWNQLARGA